MFCLQWATKQCCNRVYSLHRTGDAKGRCCVWASCHEQRGRPVPPLHIWQHREAQRSCPHAGWIPSVCCAHTQGKQSLFSLSANTVFSSHFPTKAINGKNVMSNSVWLCVRGNLSLVCSTLNEEALWNVFCMMGQFKIFAVFRRIKY